MKRRLPVLPVVLLVALASACDDRPKPNPMTFNSNVDGVVASYEVHRHLVLIDFLAQQKPGSTDALLVDAMPAQVVVLARVSVLMLKPSSILVPTFATTLTYENGDVITKRWRASRAKGPGEYRLILGLPREVVKARTEMVAPGP